MVPRTLALAVLLAPLAARGQSTFDDTCHLTIDAEIAQVPFDNALKYGTLVVLTLIPETSPAALALTREEVTSDVMVAALRGAARCLRDPEKRQRAIELIAIAKGLNDWRGFGNDLQDITGMSPSEILSNVAITDDTLNDLIDGGLAFEAEIVRDLRGGRQPTFQTELSARLNITYQFAGECQWRSSERLSRVMHDLMDARRPVAVTEMIRASGAITGRPLTTESELLAFDATRYLNTHAGDVSKFLAARGDYILIDRTKQALTTLAQRIVENEDLHTRARGRIAQYIDGARHALEQCNVPRMASALRLVSEERRLMATTPLNSTVGAFARALAGEPAGASGDEFRLEIAGNAGCWSEAVADYNDLVTDYLRLRDINVPGRDITPLAGILLRGQSAVDACDASGANAALRDAKAALPASLDPGNLCINAARAEEVVADFEREMGPALAACNQTQTPPPPSSPEAGFVTCPEPPYGFELRPTGSLFSGMRQPGEIHPANTGSFSATCAYAVIGREHPLFSASIGWDVEGGYPAGYMCSLDPGEPLIQSTGTWELSSTPTTTEEWKGPYTDYMSIGVSFDLVYSSHQRVAWAEMSEYQEGAFRNYARWEWRHAAATHLLREAEPYAWTCPQ